MKKAKGIVWGIVIVAIGIILGLNAVGITDIDIFFDGWWTLFIIIPCGISVFTSKNKVGNIIGVTVGVILLLNCLEIIDFEIVWKVVVPVLIIAFGIKLIFNNAFTKKEFPKIKIGTKSSTAIFSGKEIKYDDEIFNGATYTAVFGGIESDLRGAAIQNNAVINVTVIFGGVDILLPENVNVKTSSTSFFGGIDSEDHLNNGDNAITVYVNATSIFGGIDVK